MIPRHLAPTMLELARDYPVLTLTGPRQSGKTTLVRSAFPGWSYVSLEDPDHRRFALEDPRGFLKQFQGPAILDEAQRAPEIFSYLQTQVDQTGEPGQFVLSGSQNFLLLEAVSQTLAGRAAILHLLPLSMAEVGRGPVRPTFAADRPSEAGRAPTTDLEGTLFRGFYPRLHDRPGLDSSAWYGNYYRTYIERDVRQLTNVGDLELFSRFVRLCAGRSGQLLNLSQLGNDAGVTHSTARRWLSILEASFLVALLRPYRANFRKRLVKSPKLYMLDPGLLCYLLGIRSAEELRTHATRGAIFESYVLAEILKGEYNRAVEPRLYFWRTSSGHEVDFVIERGDRIIPVEAKSGRTFASDFLKGLEYWRSLSTESATGHLVYGGDDSYVRSGASVHAWWDLG